MELYQSFDKYLNLPREQAYNYYLDEKNLKVFKLILLIFSLAFAIIFIINLGENKSINISLIITIINLITLVSLRILYKNIFNISNIRKYIFIFLIAELLLLISIDIVYPGNNEISDSKQKKEIIKTDALKTGDLKVSFSEEEDDSIISYILFFGILLLVFRFSRTEIIQLFAIGVGVPLIAMLLLNEKFSPSSSIPSIMIALLFFIIVFTSERKRQRKFFEQYDFYYRKNYENIRMKKELNYAREIQLSMLPQNNATIGELEISGISNPASEVGGDYFDYFKISDSEVGIFICDVSGHGVASGLLLSGLRSCMHLILEDHSHPKVIIEKLNRMIRKTQNRKMFVTAIFAIVDMEKNKCMLYNAGHLPPYKISGESKEIFKIKKHGVALGAMNSVENMGSDNEVVFDFKKNDKLVLYTDGVNEAMNNNKAEYGLDNLELYLNTNADKKTKELLNGLLSDVKKFSDGSLQRDDLTLLIIQRN